MRVIKQTIVFTIITVLLFALSGCTSAPKAEKLNVDDVRKFSDSAAEKILSGMNEVNYPKFSEDFDPKMKDALTEQKFKDIVSQLGKCESKELADADMVQGYSRAYYKAKFSKSSKDVIVTIVFSLDGSGKVSGLFFK